MSKELIIKFLNGSECRGHLFQTFDPEAAGVEIFRPGDDRPVPYPFEAICFVKLYDDPGKDVRDHSVIEDLRTATGETFRLLVNREERFNKGVFAYPEEPGADFTRIFFTRRGLKTSNGWIAPSERCCCNKGR
ncbi:MAG: hypothetical protein RBT64_12940 [Trichloromonas sp.]|nr:hypothetical protein [Trichloromonas sp.]